MGVHDQSPPGQMPSVISDEHAMYGMLVSYEIPAPVSLPSASSHWYGPSTEPPWHEPPPAQFRMCCTLGLMSTPCAPRAILTRSASALTEPCAQHEPQYWGRCWLRLIVQYEVPSTSHHEKLAGISTRVAARSP